MHFKSIVITYGKWPLGDPPPKIWNFPYVSSFFFESFHYEIMQIQLDRGRLGNQAHPTEQGQNVDVDNGKSKGPSIVYNDPKKNVKVGLKGVK